MHIVVFVLISCFVMGTCYGDESIATQTFRDKRSDGLMRELVDLLTEQKKERKNLLKRCEYLEGTVKKLTTTLGTTKRSLKNLSETSIRQHSNTQKQIIDISGTVKDLNIRTKQHSSQLAKIQNDIKTRNSTKALRNGIGFSVKFKHGAEILYRHGAIVKFNNVISNYGNGFSVATGKFTCKVPGLYFFTVTVMSKTNHGAVCMMTNIKNNARIIYALATYEVPRNKSRERYGSGTASVVLKLSVGDEVFVESYSFSGSVIFEWNSSFSGMLISA